MRSPFDRPQGLGSAKSGVGHWWGQRLSAVALIPLTLWFVASLIAHAHLDYGAVIAWLRMPSTAILMVLLLVALFYHTALGIRVVIEDYVHVEWVKFAAVVVVELACFALAVAGIFAALRVAFSAPA